MTSNDSSKTTFPDISAVIVNYRTPELTHRAIASIFDLSVDIAKEVLVVDNASGDDSVPRIRAQWGPRITLLCNSENLGFGRANNQAMRQAKGRYYFLLNSDAQVIENSLEQMVRYADQHPQVGILGCTVVSKEGAQQASCWRKYTLAYLFSRALNLYRLLPDGWLGTTNIEQYGKPDRTRAVEVVSGCVMLVRREAAERVGLFDERFFMYCEDMDWCVQMRAGGYEVHFLAEARVLHLGGGTSASMHSEMTMAQGRSTLQFFTKHYGKVVAWVANVLLGLFYVLRLPAWLLLAFRPGGRNSARQKIRSYTRSLLWHLGWPLISR